MHGLAHRPAALWVLCLALSLAACGGGGGPGEPVLVAADLLYVSRAGADPALTSLDIYYVGDTGTRPVVLYVHGGAWTIGDKSAVHLKADYFVSRGYVFVSTNYRLSPAAAFPEHAEDVAAATAWVRDNIDAYGGDGSRITLMGHSAGCHLVALVATAPQFLAAEGMTRSELEAVVCLDTQAYDLPYLATLNGGSLPALYEFVFGTDPLAWAAASPQMWLTPGAGIAPMVVAYSAGITQGDTTSRRLESEAFVAGLLAVGVPAELVPSPQQTHAEINQEFGAPGDAVTAAVMTFLQGL